MKNKLLTLQLACAITLLSSCGATEPSLKILSPTGGPAIAFYDYYNNDNYETTTNPQTIMPMFKTENYDVIVAPTQGGITQIVKQNAKYKIAATITFGNFYIVSTGHDDDNVMNENDNVLIFQENDLPGRVFKYLYSDLNLNLTSVGNAASTKNVIENNGILKGDDGDIKFDYIFTAEPVVFATKSTIFKNVEKDFETKTGGLKITQASIFVKNNSSKALIDGFLNKVSNDIEVALLNPDIVNEAISQVGSNEAQSSRYGVTGKVASQILKNGNGFSLGYKKAIDIKNDIQSFLNLFHELNIGELNEEIFYQ